VDPLIGRIENRRLFIDNNLCGMVELRLSTDPRLRSEHNATCHDGEFCFVSNDETITVSYTQKALFIDGGDKSKIDFNARLAALYVPAGITVVLGGYGIIARDPTTQGMLNIVCT